MFLSGRNSLKKTKCFGSKACRAISLFLCLVCMGDIDGQQHDVDSLERTLQEDYAVDDKLKTIMYLATEVYGANNSGQTIKLVPQLDNLMSHSQDEVLKTQLLLIVAASYYRIGDLPTCQKYLELISPAHVEVLLHENQFRYHTMKAMILESRSDYKSAMEFHEKALQAAKTSKKYAQIGSALNNIGLGFKKRGQKNTATKYFREAIENFEKDESAQYFLGLATSSLAETTDDFKEHEENYQKALDIFQALGNNNMVDLVHGDHAIYLFYRRHFEEAIKFGKLSCARGLLGVKALFNCRLAMLESYIYLHRLEEAKLELNQLESLVAQYPQNFDLNSHMLLSGATSFFYARNGEFKKAYEMEHRRFLLFDSLEYSSNSESVSNFEVKYETAKKERQISEQQLVIQKEKTKRGKQLLMAISILALGVVAGLLYFMRLQKKRRKMQFQFELQQLESEKLKEVDQIKSRWFENISHDIRTPLTLISAPIKDLLKSTKSTTNKKLLSIADRNSQHLLSLTNEMLELARLENNMIPVSEKSQFFHVEAQKMIQAFASYAEEKGVSIISQFEFPQDVTLRLDYDKYEKIFNNLFKNAIQYSSKGSEVEVKISLIKNRLATRILDQGPGIPADEIPYLFDKYFRSDKPLTRNVAGSGIGLHIVHELLELLNGEVNVKSTVGEGTEFIFTIPVTTQDMMPNQSLVDDSEILPTNVAMPGFNTSRILIVEDTDEMREYLDLLLSSYYRVDLAPSAQRALQLLEHEIYDLILSDIMMPGLNGFEFKKQLDLNEDHKATPFIFLSAKALDSDKMEGLKLGVDDYLTKPFLSEELLVRIKNVLARAHTRRLVLDQTDVLVESANSDTITHKCADIVKANFDNPNFGVDDLSKTLHYSARQLNRILKEACGMTTVQFILEVRLLEARQLLLSQQVYTTKEVQHRVGILSQSYFSKKYKDRFGVAPGAAF